MTKYNLPKKVIFCKKCVQSNQRPNTSPEFEKSSSNIGTLQFDNDVCHACKYYEEVKNKINWKDRYKELEELCNKFRSKDGNYDVLVPGSGGKDSIFVSHYLKFKMKMNPLTITWAPHMYTDIGWRNFQSWLRLGFDNILFTPNYKVHSKLSKLAFKKLVNPFQPFIVGQKNLAPKIADKYNIKLIMYGENNAEVHNNINDTHSPLMDPKHYSVEDYNKELFLSGLNFKDLKENHNLNENDLDVYKPGLREKFEKKNIVVHFMSHYINWSPHDNYYYVKKHSKFESNPDGRSEGTYTKFVGLDDKMDGQNFFTMHVKFGHGRATNDACRDIRDGYISRDEAIHLVNKYDGEFPKKYFKDILDYLDITENEYWEIIDNARPDHIWKRDGNKWKLKNQIK